jgi:hypothetical protein
LFAAADQGWRTGAYTAEQCDIGAYAVKTAEIMSRQSSWLGYSGSSPMSHPSPSSSHEVPKYWTLDLRDLSVVVQAYRAEKDLTVRDVALMREYLRQWVDSPVWEMKPHETDAGRHWLAELRERVRVIASRDDIEQALSIMTARRMDPL